MLSEFTPAVAVLQPCGAFGVGGGLHEGIGSITREIAEARALPRIRRVWAGAASFSPQGTLVGNGGAAYQPNQHKCMTRTNPVYTGVLGPYPGREPKPV